MENKSHALAAGSFVLLLGALLLLSTLWLSHDRRDLRTYELAGDVNLTGLQAQASVRYKGVSVGKVTHIALNPAAPGQVLVQIAVEAHTPITTSTVASLGHQGVTGLAFIALDDPTPGNPALPADGSASSRLPLQMGFMGRITEQGERLLGQWEQSGQRLNALLAADNQQALLHTLAQISQAAQSLRQLTEQTRQTLPQLTQTTTATLQSIQSNAQRVGDSLQEVRSAALAFRQVSERMSAPGGTLEQIAHSTDALSATSQTLRLDTLPRINQAMLDTARLARQWGELGQTLNQNPQTLLLGTPAPASGPGEPGFKSPIQP